MIITISETNARLIPLTGKYRRGVFDLPPALALATSADRHVYSTYNISVSNIDNNHLRNARQTDPFNEQYRRGAFDSPPALGFGL